MSFLLPQTIEAMVTSARPLSIHGDLYVDLLLVPAGHEDAPVSARIAAGECPAALQPGERVLARIVMGVVTRVDRA